ncbi:MAG TPA: VTT domain-containing protein [Aestuariivirgaceae bacterium]
MATSDKTLAPAESARRPFLRWLPLILLAAIAFAWAFNLDDYLSLLTIAENREALRSFVTENLVLSLSAYALVYVLSTALLLPGAALLTLFGGFLFGWQLAAPVTILSATLGATLIFWAARSSFGGVLLRRGGVFANKLASGFAADAFCYLLFLRLVPVFPFFIVNIAPALCNVRTRIFLLATLIGIAPATVAYSVLGAGLDFIIQAELVSYRQCMTAASTPCSFMLDPFALLTPPMLAAFLLLGVLALIPPVLKHLRAAKWNPLKHP